MGHLHGLAGTPHRRLNMGQMRPSQTAALSGLPWKRGLAWLMFLGPLFFLSYGFSNQWAASRAITDSMVFDWERHIPFAPWTIVPYWSIDLFYGLSFLLCRSSMQVDRHALRLLTAQLISVACFILFPLHFTFDRPTVDGFFGVMFDILMGFDQPYNQAPSLHISLLVILWVRFAASAHGPWRMFVHLWSALICISVLTTYQHHFIDIPTGLLAGLICVWLWPDTGATPLAHWQLTGSSQRRRLSAYYFLSALSCTAVAVYFKVVALWLFWPAVAFAWVGLIYAGLGVSAFQKEQGKFSIATYVMLAPYLAGAWLNSRWWTRRHPQPDEIMEGIWLGRLPTKCEMREGGFVALLDLTAEMPAPRGNWRYDSLPWLDLVVPEAEQLAEAVRRIEILRKDGPLLVCCALGYSRSACGIAAWLLLTGRVKSVDEALIKIAAQRPQVVLGEAHKRVLNDCLREFGKGAMGYA